jgi:hypothetical protein
MIAMRGSGLIFQTKILAGAIAGASLLGLIGPAFGQTV